MIVQIEALNLEFQDEAANNETRGMGRKETETKDQDEEEEALNDHGYKMNVCVNINRK